MSLVVTEISVFGPKSRKTEAAIRSLIPKQAVERLAEQLGAEAGQKASKALRQMQSNDMDLVQIRFDDKRIRIKQGS